MAEKTAEAVKGYAKVTFNYAAENPDELSLQPGQVVEVLVEEEEGWWKGRLDGKEGVFPSNFVKKWKPPLLTVDSVLTAVQGVDWRTLGEALLPCKVDGAFFTSYPKLHEIEQQHPSDDDRLHAVVKTWVHGGGRDKEPSWRCFIWRLDRGNVTVVADNMRYYAEPLLDPTLTVENTAKVMKEVDWVKYGGLLDVHTVAGMQRIKEQVCSEQEKSHSLTQYWVNTYPLASWGKLAHILYQEGEERAVALAKQFLPKADPTLTTDNLMEVVKEIEHRWWDLAIRIGVQPSKMREILSLSQNDHQKMEAMLDHYTRYHPTASWNRVAEALLGMELPKLAEEVTTKYVTGPDRVEHYSDLEFMEKVGVGGYGAVSKGRWISRKKIVAIKTMINFVEREVEILSSLDHPSIIKCYGVVEEKNLHYIVTEFAENGSVYDYIHKEHKQPSLPQRLLWAKEVAEGMIYLHHRNIIHRDLKSSNVVLTSELKAKICDLGSARKFEHTAKQTTIIGTYAWMAPEMINRDSVSKSCDVYSYGIFLWELLTQQQPFSDVHPQFLVMTEVLEGKRPPIPATCEWYLAKLLNRCWQMEAKARPNFEEVLVMLNKESSDATSQPSPKIRSPSGVTTPDMTPRMAQLMRLKTSEGGRVEIIKTIAPDWLAIGLLMDLDPKGQKVKSIEAEHAQNGPQICCREMFMLWLDSPDATWGNLIELLIDSEQEELAGQVKGALGL